MNEFLHYPPITVVFKMLSPWRRFNYDGIELLSYEEIDFEEKLSQKNYVFVHLRAMKKMSAIKEIVAFFWLSFIR